MEGLPQPMKALLHPEWEALDISVWKKNQTMEEHD